jgi:putative transposase
MMLGMIQRRAFRFRLEPDGAQRQKLARFGGAARWVWNRALAEQKRRLEAGERTAGYAEMCRSLTEWRHSPETPWLAEVHVNPLQQTLKDLDRAVRDSFRPGTDPARKRFPRFRKKSAGDHFRYPASVKTRVRPDGWAEVWLPKVGWVRYRSSRPIEGRIAQATLSEEGEQWFVSIQTEREVPEPAASEQPPVGIDLGVVRFATLSDGSYFEPLAPFKRGARQLARAQRRLSRKHKGSKNWRKQQRRVARLRRAEGRARLDFLHKTSTTIAKNHGVVVLEDLSVGQMSRSARGTPQEPGKNVRQKAGLNRSILDQGWGMFRALLAYKLAERGGRLVLVEAAYTSQRCSECGHTCPENRKGQALFCCAQCGYSAHADHNAARNILEAAGHAVQACGGKGHRPPDEAGTRGEAA